jgi:metallo-beta-lactamase class B
MIRLSLTAAIATTVITTILHAQQRSPADHPAVTVNGQTYTPASIFTRNMGTTADQETPFPPHKIVGNVYYVGTRTLSAFLVVTPQGHVLIDSTYERNVPAIKKSIEQLGFKFSDIKILLGNHAARRSSGRRRRGEEVDRRDSHGDG